MHLLTPWCRVLLKNLTGLQLVKKFLAFYGTRRFITALTIVRHLSLSWARPIQSTYPHPTSWRSILILSTHLRLGLPGGLFPSGFPTKTLFTKAPYHPFIINIWYKRPVSGRCTKTFSLTPLHEWNETNTSHLGIFLHRVRLVGAPHEEIGRRRRAIVFFGSSVRLVQAD